MWSAGTISVSCTSSRVRVVGLLVVQRLDPLAGGHGALGRRPRGRGSGPRRTPRGTSPLPNVWSKCSWVLTTADHLAGAEPAYVVDDRAGRRARRVGVDDQQPAVAADEGDVDVEPLVPGHPDPVGDLGERRCHGAA